MAHLTPWLVLYKSHWWYFMFNKKLWLKKTTTYCHVRENVLAPTWKLRRFWTQHFLKKGFVMLFSWHAALILSCVWSRLQWWVKLMKDFCLFPPVQTAVGLTKQRTQWRTLGSPIQIPTPARLWVTILAKTAMAIQVQRQSTQQMLWFGITRENGWLFYLLIYFLLFTKYDWEYFLKKMMHYSHTGLNETFFLVKIL